MFASTPSESLKLTLLYNNSEFMSFHRVMYLYKSAMFNVVLFCSRENRPRSYAHEPAHGLTRRPYTIYLSTQLLLIGGH